MCLLQEGKNNLFKCHSYYISIYLFLHCSNRVLYIQRRLLKKMWLHRKSYYIEFVLSVYFMLQEGISLLLEGKVSISMLQRCPTFSFKLIPNMIFWYSHMLGWSDSERNFNPKVIRILLREWMVTLLERKFNYCYIMEKKKH